MPFLPFIIMLLAMVLLLLSAAGVNHPRVNLGQLGLGLWAGVVAFTVYLPGG